jgi:CARDB
MKRFLIAALAVLALGAATAADGRAVSQFRAHLRGFACQRALDPPARALAVTAVMRPLQGTSRMALRFQLLSKSKTGGSYSALTGGDLGTWISPANPTLGQRVGDVWILKKQVAELSAPAAYRFRVSFRWTGAHGHVLGSAVRDSPTCVQPELRPDLLVQSIDVTPVTGMPDLNRYVARIRNAGATAAGSFEVLFAPGGALPVKIRQVQRLGAHSKLEETFVGPACSTTSPPSVTVDPNDQVDDYNRPNNSLTAICPGSAASSRGPLDLVRR